MNRYETYKIDAANTKTTPQGFLEVRAYTARTGVQKYKRADGSILREYRPEQEVFTDKNIEALKTSPVTNGHPPVMVTPENSKQYMVGFPTKGVRKVDNDGPEKYLETWLTITDKDAIAAIKAGKAQVSNGYAVELDWTPGLYKGEKYDAIQRKIVNNHIAIVWHARGGGNVRLHLDAEDAEKWEVPEIAGNDVPIIHMDECDSIDLDAALREWRFGEKKTDLLRIARGVAKGPHRRSRVRGIFAKERAITKAIAKKKRAREMIEIIKKSKTLSPARKRTALREWARDL